MDNLHMHIMHTCASMVDLDFAGPSIRNQFKNLSVDHVIEVFEQDLGLVHGQRSSLALMTLST